MANTRQKPGLSELQAMANDHAENVLQRVTFPMPEGATDDAFAALMDVIVQQLVAAWATGYMAGTKR